MTNHTLPAAPSGIPGSEASVTFPVLTWLNRVGDALAAGRLRPLDLAVAHALTRHNYDRTGRNLWPAASTLAAQIGHTSDRPTRDALKRLCQAGLLILVRHGGGSGASARGNHYALAMPEQAPNSGIGVPEPVENSGTDEPQTTPNSGTPVPGQAPNSGTSVLPIPDKYLTTPPYPPSPRHQQPPGPARRREEPPDEHTLTAAIELDGLTALTAWGLDPTEVETHCHHTGLTRPRARAAAPHVARRAHALLAARATAADAARRRQADSVTAVLARIPPSGLPATPDRARSILASAGYTMPARRRPA